MTQAQRTRVRTFPVIESFGPTVQGEGRLAGLPTYFVRFGGCDYRCSWCDSMYAVDPTLVRENAVKLSADDIMEELDRLPVGAAWVTLSGGNPALLDLGELVASIQREGGKVAVETQGSRWRPWLASVDCLTVSPKPPSSGMARKTDAQLHWFMARADEAMMSRGGCLKIVVFDLEDLAWAKNVLADYPAWPAYLSCGTDTVKAGETHEETLVGLSTRYRWLCERVAADQSLAHVRVLPQIHLIAWGHQRGV